MRPMEFKYEDGIAKCTIYYNGMPFIGEASCHPEDSDFMSERVGLCIAEARANIKILCFKRDYEIKPQLKILTHFHNNIKNSKHYNKKSYEVKMLRRQIQAIKKELATTSNEIADERQFLKDYIDGKEKLYQRLRAKHR